MVVHKASSGWWCYGRLERIVNGASQADAPPVPAVPERGAWGAWDGGALSASRPTSSKHLLYFVLHFIVPVMLQEERQSSVLDRNDSRSIMLLSWQTALCL